MADESDIAVIGIQVDSSQVDASTAALDRWLAKGREVDALATRLAASTASAFKGVDPRMLSDGMAGIERQATAADAALQRMAANTEKAMAGISAAMRNAMGPSPAGGSAAHPFGPQWKQSLAGATQGYIGLTRAADGAAGATERMAAANANAERKLAAATGVTAADVAARFAHTQASSKMAEAEDILAGRFGKTTEALHAGAAAHTAHGHAAYGNSLQMIELAHVGRALFDEMMAGGNVLRGLAMEFGRLQIAITSGEGGITGMLGRVAGFAGRLASPLALATAGVAAFGTAAVVGFGRYEAEQESLERVLNLRGRYSGLTLDSANALAGSSAAAGGLSVHEATGLAGTYLGAGLGRDLTGSLIDSSRDFGRLTGKSTDEAGKFLAGALADPVRGLAELDRTLGGVDDRLKQQVEDLTRSGHVIEAQNLELAYVNRAMHEAADSTFSFSRSLSGVGNWISNGLGALGHGVATAFGYGSDADNLAKNKALLAELIRSDPSGTANAADIAAVRAEIARLQANITQAGADAARKEADGRAIALSGRAGDAVRALMPEIARQRSAADTVDLIRQALSDPLVLGHLDPGISPAMLGRAFSQANVLQAENRPGVREAQDYALSLSRARDIGVEDQGLNTARRAELDVLRSTGDVVRSVTAAQRSYNVELASAQERAERAAETSKQNFDLIGLSPFDRALKELDNKYLGKYGEIENYRLDKGGANVLNDKDIAGDLRGGYAILTAGQDAAGKLTAAGGHLVTAIDGIAAKVDEVAGRIGTGPYGGLDRGAFGARAGAPAPFFAASADAYSAAPANVRGMIDAASAQTGMPAGIIAALGQRENGFQLTGATHVLGADGRPATSAYGYGQLTDGAASDVARVLPGFSKFDPSTAVLGSAEYLKILQGRFGDMQTALDHYGTGPGYGADILRRAGAGALAAAPTGGSTLTVGAREAPTAPIAYSGGAVVQGQYATDKAGVLKTYQNSDPGAFGTPLGDANRRLQEQQVLTEMQSGSMGKLDLATRSAVEGQKLWDDYLNSGAEKTMRLSDANGALAASVRAFGMSAAEAAIKADDLAKRQQVMVEVADTVRGGASGILSSGFTSMAHGQTFAKGARSAAASFGDSLISKGTGMLFSSLLGAQGSPFGGLLGSLFGPSVGLPMSLLGQGGIGHFAGGTQDAPGGPTIVGESGPELVDMPKGAQVMTAGQTSGLMASRGGGSGHTFNFGDNIVNVQGDVSEQNRAMIQSAVAAGNQRVIDHVTRNLTQIQSDSRQY